MNCRIKSIVIAFATIFAWQTHAADTICTQEYAPVCGMPYFECPEWAVCSRPMDVTYSNMCKLEAADATLQYKWVCEHDKPTSCPENYDPVCGKTQAKTCLSLDCAQRNETYWNMCFLESDNAEFLYKGECKQELPEATSEKDYVWDTQKCMIIRYVCDDGYNYFSDSIWCGCEKDPVTPEMKKKIDAAIESFMQRLESKWYSQIIVNATLLKLSEALQDMKQSKPQYKDIINYTLQKLDSY